MHFIENIIEPSRLYLAWQPSGDDYGTRFIVGEFIRDELGEVSLRYFSGTKDFENAKRYYFDGYPAWPALSKVHSNVLDSLLRRIPPRTRGDFSQYLEGLRLHKDAQLSDFALLGYSGAKLLSDGFLLIHPFENVVGPCELLMEVAGFRLYSGSLVAEPSIGQKVLFGIEFNAVVQEDAVWVKYDNQLIGYVNRGLRKTFVDWITNHRLGDAFIEKINGPQRPAVYVFVQIKRA